MSGAYPLAELPLSRAILWYPAGRAGAAARGERAPRRGGYPIFLEQAAITAIRAHLEAAPDQPLMGFLAGELYRCPDTDVVYLVVDGILRCRYPIEGQDPMPTFRKVWTRLEEEVRKMQGRLAGWYRSRPDGETELSVWDIAVHEAFFHDPWQIAVTARVDRFKPAGGVYRMAPGYEWAASPMPFYELLERQPRRSSGGKRTVLTWKNYATNEVVLAADERRARRPSEATAAAPAAAAPSADSAPTVETAAAAPPAKRPTIEVIRSAAPRPGAEPVRGTARPTVSGATLPAVSGAALPAVTVATSARGRRRRRGLVVAAGAAGVMLAAAAGVRLVLGGDARRAGGAAANMHAVRLARLDRLSDTLAVAVRNYGERVALHRDGLLGCAGLSRGYAAVDQLWIVYSATRAGLAAPLDSARDGRDRRLAAAVDSLAAAHARSGCGGS